MCIRDRRTLVPGSARGHDTLLADGHLGCGPLGAPPSYAHSPLSPQRAGAHTPVSTPPGAPVTDVPVTAPDGTSVRLRDRLGRGHLLVVLVAPGTGVWDRRHWLTAGVMPRLVEAVDALPVKAELLVSESYPGATAHTVLLVRPDGYLVAAFHGVRPAELHAAADAARGGDPGTTHGTRDADGDGGAPGHRDGTAGDRADGRPRSRGEGRVPGDSRRSQGPGRSRGPGASRGSGRPGGSERTADVD